jgi:serine/threonine protein kinase/tetratricopeptide (TPR) repeat protein
MGTVYLARDQRLGRQVALKVLNSEDLATDERRARFLREARAAAAIRHQNIATIYEVDETHDGLPFLVMEYCEGETLSQRIRRKPLDTGSFLSIARQLACGVAAAHDNGVVHRDLKSANVIIEPSGLVKILDFGLAKLTPAGDEKQSFESTSGHFFGTLHYISPEQARGGVSDARSDLFSIGVVMYQMATGHLPFNADSPLLVLEKIRDAEPEAFVALDSAFPPAVTRILGKLLQKDPDSRYQNAHELLRDLEEIDTPTAAMTATSAQSRSSLRRTVASPRWIRLAIIVAAFVVGALVIWSLQRRESNDRQRASEAASAPPPPVRSLAVLPLDNLSSAGNDEFLSVGLADALVTKLQQIPSLQVRPTSAIVEFHNNKRDAKTVSDKLHVDAILEGHFLAAGDLVRVTLQLTDTRTGYSIWADSVDGKRANLLQLIDAVSSKTVMGLNQKLGVQQLAGHSEARSSNPKAYEEYLKARALNGSFTAKDHAAQIAALKRAIALDPNFAAAYADLAIAMALGQARGLQTESNTLQMAEWYARQAVRIDPNLAQAHLALGRTFIRFPDRYRESVREVLAALRIDANDTHALNTMATYFIAAGDAQKAQCIGDRMISLDPSSNDAKIRGYWYVNAVDPEGALQNARFALASSDTELAGHDIRGCAFLLLGNLDEADKERQLASAIAPTHYIGKSLAAMIAAARGDRAAMERAIASFTEDANRNHWAALRVSLCYARIGDRDKAVQWLHRAVELGNRSWYALVKHPWVQSLQTDPEFAQMVANMKSDIDDVRDDVIGVFQLICKQ